MRSAEIIAVGTELLLGQIVNSNAAFISKELAECGVYVYHHTVVGDNPERLKKVIEIAESRSDILIFSGGLGPTEDDITKQVLAEYLKKNIVYDADHLTKIEQFFAAREDKMSENNKRQAEVIEGSQVLSNDFGFAAGMFLEANAHTYILLPGPPSEMQPMFTKYAKPFLLKNSEREIILESKIIRFFGIGESKLADDLKDMIANQTNPTIATYAGENEVVIRVTASAKTREEALELIKATEEEIIKRDGAYIYGSGEVTLVDLVIQQLMDANMTISAAESLTAGLFQAELGGTTGISKIFKGGMVTYSSEMKHELLHVSKKTIEQEGVVSQACAIEMADNIRELCNTDIGISFTGVAGPEELEGNPVGTVWIGLSVVGSPTLAYRYTFNRDRNYNRRRAVKEGFALIKAFLDEKSDKKVE
ncbi:competence damage-inducible protein A [Listeria weihenstephanensis FSL R9-0317]|uniref:Putative competence-damage inducible protein n=1 Tax=Listeria weihenstephanensis TaxID=1006155 RepID=A0A1S7FUL8_9LIST|nr:competence/damage-inducible protein A [Listeria weihenstephanensis]AQY51057.1 damage-inducible protein CinA [Listeria weihenstephanensis]EUJ36475.1 competence damage-inducible protein A [Listeria weihenstephanensis FSL R9-0317]